MRLFSVISALVLAAAPLGLLGAQEAPEDKPQAEAAFSATGLRVESGEVREEPGSETRREAEEHGPRRFGQGGRPFFGEQLIIRTNEIHPHAVMMGGEAVVQGIIEGDLIVVGGSVDISGTVEGNVVVVGGEVHVSGRIEGDLVVPLGSVELTDTAVVEENFVVVGGPIQISPEAKIGGDRVAVPIGHFLPQIDGLKRWLAHGPLYGRLLTFDVAWPWVLVAIVLFLHALSLVLFPGSARGVYTALENQPVTSLICGLLALVLFAPLVVVLAISVVGIAVIPFLMIALVLALLFGKIGVICFFGRSVGRSSGVAALQTPFFAFLVGSVVITLAYAVPIIGIFAWAMATVFGLGGATLAMVGALRRESPAVAPAPVLLSTLQPGRFVEPARETNPPGAASPGFEPPLAGANPPDHVLLQRAGFWRRLLAAVLDLVLLSLLIPVLGPLVIPAAVAYFVAMWTWKGTTVGSIVLGLKLVRNDGGKVSLIVALVRSFSSLFSLLALGLGFLWVGWDREKQAWHDKIAGTMVVRMPADLSLI